MIDALVVGRELQSPVQVQAEHVRLALGDVPLGDYGVLIGGLQPVDHAVLEQGVAEPRGPLGAEYGQHDE